MAEQHHLVKLMEGAEAWNKWRAQNPEVVPDLDRIDLKGANLAGADFSKARLQRANLREAKS